MNNKSKENIASKIFGVIGLICLYIAKFQFDYQAIHSTVYYIACGFTCLLFAHQPQILFNKFDFKKTSFPDKELHGFSKFLFLIALSTYLIAVFLKVAALVGNI